METSNVESRLQSLEEQMREVLNIVKVSALGNKPTKDWRRALGMFDDDQIMKQIDEAGRHIRQQDRESNRE